MFRKSIYVLLATIFTSMSAFATDIEDQYDTDIFLTATWKCSASNGKLKYTRSAATKARAQQRSLATCQAHTPIAPRSCYVKKCWVDAPPSPPTDSNYPYCQFNMDCGLWEVCAGGVCVPQDGDQNQCNWSGDCDGFSDCVGGRCVPKP